MKALARFLIKNRWGINILINTLLIIAVYFLSFLVRFDGVIPALLMSMLERTLVVVVVCKLSIFHLFNLHQGLLRYASMHDLVRLIKASVVSSMAFTAVVMFVFHQDGYPRSVFVIDWLITVLLFGGRYMSFRIWREMRGQQNIDLLENAGNALIIGAGDAGELALREMNNNPSLFRNVVGFLDDDPAKLGLRIHGIAVIGPVSDARRVVEQRDVDEVLIAMPSAGRKIIQQVVESCAKLNVKFRILPAMADLISGRTVVQPIRDVQVEDLLTRDAITFDPKDIADDIGGTSVLVTGAGGSIGSELVRQIAGYQPAHLLLLDNAETPLFDIHNEIHAKHPELACTPVLADVRDCEVIRHIFDMHRPQRVYHAAAYKHVPMMERYPSQAIINNVRGTRILASTALEYEAERFVMVSTDKAVKPKSVMGASKRICELVATSFNGKGTHFSVVRFGNVLGSNGSVIPTFRKQIEKGGPVTVTHAEMTRYFMTIPEAVSLLLKCGTLAEANDTYVLDMGVPIKIMDLAKSMIALSGLTLGKDIEIEITGLRPGEKIHEELVTYGENIKPAGVEKINVVRNSSQKMEAKCLHDAVARLEALAESHNDEALLALLWGMIKLDQEISEG